MAAHHHQTDGPRVVAVDAMPDNLAYLRTSIAANEFPGDLVALVNAALRWALLTSPSLPSDVEGNLYPVRMNLDSESNPSTNPGSIQFLSQMEVGGRGVLGPPTPSITLPSLLASLPPGAPAIIKMDIQGQECRVLRSPGLQAYTTPATPSLTSSWNGTRCFLKTAFFVQILWVCWRCWKHRDTAPGGAVWYWCDLLSRWPDSLASMPRHCLGSKVSDVLWVHQEARQLGGHWGTVKGCMLNCNKTVCWNTIKPCADKP